MGTKSSNYKEFVNLWNLFEKEIQETDKFEPKNIYGFAKFYLSIHPEEDTTVKNLKRKIERWKEGIKENRNFQRETINQLNDFCKFLNETYFVQELLDDEKPEHWFD
ncbi:hypothetical protein [Malaciobacter canalis]|uniref:hypothetical protein n=1 Tax=Malaciobacter canalis TaxID=1912871 RepID=UPI00384D27D2